MCFIEVNYVTCGAFYVNIITDVLIVDKRDRENMVAHLKNYGEFNNLEILFKKIDGTPIWIRYSGKIVPDKGWIEGVSEDITEYRKIQDDMRMKNKEYETANEELNSALEEMETANEELLKTNDKLSETYEALQQSENRYRLLLDLAVDGILHGSHDGIITDVNKCFLTITGLSREDLVGKHIEVVPFTKESIENHPLRFDLLKKGEVVISQRNILRPDGSEVSVEMRTKMMPDGSYQSIYRDITENKRIEQQIASLLAEKELLLEEVHHRMKNNMNTIISIISLQWRSLKDDSAKAALEDAQNRVRSMMVLYDKLYKSLIFKEISVKSYLPSLINEIVSNFPENEKIEVEDAIDDFCLSAKILSPLGIIINEMLTNSMKHAFNDMDEGRIRVTASYDGKKAVLTVEDNGIGIYANPAYDDSECFGLQIVAMLVKQINGSYRLENKNGTLFTLEFDL